VLVVLKEPVGPLDKDLEVGAAGLQFADYDEAVSPIDNSHVLTSPAIVRPLVFLHRVCPTSLACEAAPLP
jgi:hypothetical protein